MAKPRTSVFVLPPAKGDKSVTASVRIGNGDNQVITLVNPDSAISICSEPDCVRWELPDHSIITRIEFCFCLKKSVCPV